MPLPNSLARFNRRVTNRVLGPLASRAPWMAVVVHRGRRSGRQYETPVMVFSHSEGVTIALTYGPDVDWLKNIEAAGGCTLIQRGRARALREPRMLSPAEGRQRMPLPVRLFLRVLKVDGFVVLTDRNSAAHSKIGQG